MEDLKKKYIVNENNKRVAVQLDYKTFRKVEEIMENYALYHLMDENKGSEAKDLKSALDYYSQLEKAN